MSKKKYIINVREGWKTLSHGINVCHHEASILWMDYSIPTNHTVQLPVLKTDYCFADRSSRNLTGMDYEDFLFIITMSQSMDALSRGYKTVVVSDSK